MLERLLKKTNLFDVFLVFVGALAIIGIWRGAWNLLDAYLLPNNFIASQIVTILVGLAILGVMSRYK